MPSTDLNRAPGKELRRNALSPDGYIINQHETMNIPYGKLMSDRNGCGWISVYNYLRLHGIEKRCSEIAALLNSRSLFRSRYGTDPFNVRRVLKKSGLRVRMTIGYKNVCRRASEAESGILLYRHSGGIHYIAFTDASRPYKRFFNAISGKADHIDTVEHFLKTHNRSPVLVLFTECPR